MPNTAIAIAIARVQHASRQQDQDLAGWSARDLEHRSSIEHHRASDPLARAARQTKYLPV